MFKLDQMFQSLKILCDSSLHKSKCVPKLVKSLDEKVERTTINWEKKRRTRSCKLNLRTKNDQELHRDS